MVRKLAKTFLFFLSIVFLDFSLSKRVDSEQFDEGLSAFNSGLVKFAIQKWEPLARQGHAEAAFHLGSVYYFGDGVLVSYPVALKWFRTAADHDHAASQFMLGLMHAEGEGVDRDLKMTVDWFDKAVGK